jgi:pimeloyl-ACP methyl ester carboxylesterase
MRDTFDILSMHLVQERMLRLNGRPVSFAIGGDGPPLLYFHGTGTGCAATWPRETRLIEDGFRLIMPDRPGYGQTSLAHGWRPASCADLGAALLDRLGIARAGVIGLSAGGPPALAFAERHPQRTACLVLQSAQTHVWDSAAYVPLAVQADFSMRPLVGRAVFLARLALKARRVTRNLEALRRALTGVRYEAALADPEFAPMTRLICEASRRVRNRPGTLLDMRIYNGRPYFDGTRIAAPTLILHDPLDPIAPIAHARYAAEVLPNAELMELEAGGHLIWVGRDAEAMKRRRTAFLRRWLS